MKLLKTFGRNDGYFLAKATVTEPTGSAFVGLKNKFKIKQKFGKVLIKVTLNFG